MHFAWRVHFFFSLFFFSQFYFYAMQQQEQKKKKKNNSFINTMLRRRRRRWRRMRGSYKMLISWHAHTTCVCVDTPPLTLSSSPSPCLGQFPVAGSWATGLQLLLFILCFLFDFLIFFHIISHIFCFCFCFYHILLALIKGKVQWTNKILWRVDALKKMKWNEMSF